MKHTLHIDGMHCKSCEMMIKNALDEQSVCTITKISHKTGVCQIDCHPDDITHIESIINKVGYTIGEKNNTQPWTSDQWREKILWLALAGVLIFFLMKTDINGLMPQYETLSFGVALVIGLIASFSTCLAVTGGIIMGYNESVQTTNSLRTQIKFHIGRILTFIIGGGLLGLVGSQFTGSVWFNAVFSVLVGIVLLYLGLQLLGIVPNITKRGFHLPSFFSQAIFTLKNPRYAAGVGALTFLLPCGFTQSMQLFALQSSSPLQGAMIMGAFAVGTLPVLFGLGLGTKYIKDKVKFINPLIASLLVVFGVYTVYNGTVLMQAINISAETPAIVTKNLETEVVARSHDGSQFVPASLRLQQGKNYSIIVTPTSNGLGCNYSVIIPGQGEHSIRKGEPFTMQIDGSQAKRIKLVCGSMGMKQGEIIIE